MNHKLSKQVASYTVIFEYFPEDDGYLVTVPSLRGCSTWGKTLRKAEYNVKEVIQGYVETLVKEGLPIPKDRSRTQYKLTKRMKVQV